MASEERFVKDKSVSEEMSEDVFADGGSLKWATGQEKGKWVGRQPGARNKSVLCGIKR